MVEFDPLYVITIISLSVATIVGFFTVRNELKKSREETALRIASQIKAESTGVKQFISDRLDVVDSKFIAVDTKIQKDQEDIKDIETDMKQMQLDFKGMCDKLQKHDYIIEGVVPEFKELQKEFYHFKIAVDKMENIVISNTKSVTKDEDKK